MEDSVRCLLSRFFYSQFRISSDVGRSSKDVNRNVLAITISFEVSLVLLIVEPTSLFSNLGWAVKEFRMVCHFFPPEHYTHI